MNTDQVKGVLKEAAGKVQQKAGELVDSPEQQAKGLGLELFAITQAEIIAPGLLCRLLQYLTVVRQGQAQGRMLELFRVDTGMAEHPVQVTAMVDDKGIHTSGSRREHTSIVRTRGIQGSLGKG